jgi:hypothetical protein
MELEVAIERQARRETVQGLSLNVYGGGIFLQLREPLDLQLGEAVSCQVSLPARSEKEIPAQGTGIVVRVDEFGAAIEFEAGSFRPVAAGR